MESEILNLKMQKAMFVEICGLYNSKNKKEVAQINKENYETLKQVNAVAKSGGRKYLAGDNPSGHPRSEPKPERPEESPEKKNK